jgi:hypothetical protein
MYLTLTRLHAGLEYVRGCCADIDQIAMRLCAVLDSTARLLASRRRAARVTVWTLTTEGDNCPVSTTVYASEAEALAILRRDLCADCHPSERRNLAALPDDELTDEWSRRFDGPCRVESHEIELT